MFTVSTFVFGVRYYMYDLIFPCSYMSESLIYRFALGYIIYFIHV